MRRIAVALIAVGIWAMVPTIGEAAVGGSVPVECDAGQTLVRTDDYPKSKVADENGNGWVCQYDRGAGNSKQPHYAYVDDHDAVVITPSG